jgi:hypothetical protein
MGNGLGQSLFLRVTQEDWPASPDSHSFEAHSCEQFRRMVVLEVGAGQSFP